jgi:hypothetical protein
MGIKIVVKPTAGGNKIDKEVEPEWTIQEVKEALAEQVSAFDQQRALFMQWALLIPAAGSQCSSPSPTVTCIRHPVSGHHKPQANIPATEQRLIYKGQILKDERTVESYGECWGFPGALEEVRGSPVVGSVPAAPPAHLSCWLKPPAAHPCRHR